MPWGSLMTHVNNEEEGDVAITVGVTLPCVSRLRGESARPRDYMLHDEVFWFSEAFDNFVRRASDLRQS